MRAKPLPIPASVAVVVALSLSSVSVADAGDHGPALPVSYGPVVEPTLRPDTVIVTDDLSTWDDLSRGWDYDPKDERMLVIRWNFRGSDYTDFHVYVREIHGRFTYLGRTKAGDVSHLVWADEQIRSDLGASGLIADRFSDGPQFWHSYQFRVFGITTAGLLPIRGPILTRGMVSFREEPAEAVIEEGQVIVTDDLASTENLAPAGGGQDFDLPDERMLVIRWKFPESDYRDFHVQVQEDLRGRFTYLGRTKSGDISYLVWSQESPDIRGKFKKGPQFGRRYRFRVFGLTKTRRPLFRGPLVTAGAVEFLEQVPATPTPTPTPEVTPGPVATPTVPIPGGLPPGKVIVTDDLSTTEDLSGGEDRDTPDNRMLVIRWRFKESDYRDFHVYVKGSRGPYFYLGRTRSGTASYLVWSPRATGIHILLRDGPQFGQSYRFKVYGITKSLRPLFRGPLVTAAPVKFERAEEPVGTPVPVISPSPIPIVTLEPILTPTPVETPTETPTSAPTPTPTATPTPQLQVIPYGRAIVTDDLSSMEDLSGYEDRDLPDDRMLVIRWQFKEDKYIDFHVYVKRSRGGYTYLGRAGSGNVSYLVWTEGKRNIQPFFRDGPQFGESYRFRVYGIGGWRKPSHSKPLVTLAPVKFRELSETSTDGSDEAGSPVTMVGPTRIEEPEPTEVPEIEQEPEEHGSPGHREKPEKPEKRDNSDEDEED